MSDFASPSIFTLFSPKPKSSQECIGVVARPAPGRHFFQPFDVAAAKNHGVGLEGGEEAGGHIGYIALRFSSAVLLEAPLPYIVLEDAFLVREMA
jgi:hypothetical protein